MLYVKKIGALTSKIYSFMGRAQELERIESIDYLNIFGNSIYIEVSNLTIIRILPRLNKFKQSDQITDQIRFSYDSLYFQRILNIYENIKNNYKKSDYFKLYNYFLYLKKMTDYYLFEKKLKLDLVLLFIFNEDCDFFFIKKLFNLSNFFFVLNFKIIDFFINVNFYDFFLSINTFEKSLQTQIIQLIGVNIRMDFPLFMVIFNKKKRRKN